MSKDLKDNKKVKDQIKEATLIKFLKLICNDKSILKIYFKEELIKIK